MAYGHSPVVKNHQVGLSIKVFRVKRYVNRLYVLIQAQDIEISVSRNIILAFSISFKQVAIPDIAHQLVSPVTSECDEEILVDVVPNKLVLLPDSLPQNDLAAFALFLAFFLYCENLDKLIIMCFPR